MKSVQIQQSRHQNDANFVILVSLLLTLNIFYTLFYNHGQNQCNASAIAPTPSFDNDQ